MRYTKNALTEVSFPLGGIGTGSIGLAGNGHLIDWEIFNRPNKGSLNGYTHFAIKAEYPDGRTILKVLQGDFTKDLSGQYEKIMFGGFGHGLNAMTMAAYPHFDTVTFDGAFPFATLTFTDAAFPGEVVMTAFNPFIPLHADDSSIPAAFFEIKIKNGDEAAKYSVIFTVQNPFEKTINEQIDCGYPAIMMRHAETTPDDLTYGDLTVAVDGGDDTIVQNYWYRIAWATGMATTYWRELTDGALPARTYSTPGKNDTCSLGCRMTLGPQESRSCRFVLGWNVPNQTNYLAPIQKDGKEWSWKNYYTKLFADSAVTCRYALDNWQRLYDKTALFHASLFASTVDDVIKEAISSTISVLKSPTVLRLENGAFYGWEGVHEKAGSCEGTCTHVWSYAYALCFLFPELEKSLREVELTNDVEPSGKMNFRTRLPLGRGYEDYPFCACVDGQMATVFKIYRDFLITGDGQWVKEHWDTIKSLLSYAWSEENPHGWDRDHDGVLEGRQHHTLDRELFGPSSWLEGMYLAALKAGALLAEFVGDTVAADEYTTLYHSGRQWMKDNLFNGKYFFHKVELGDKACAERYNATEEYWNEEKQELIYQIGEGSIIDQLLAQWHANIIGLGDIFDKDQRKTALETMFATNFKPSMRDVANNWRIYALNDEAGAIICEYPEGSRRPIIPIPYCEECMTGFEYAFAGLLISEGYEAEGLTVIRAIRDRYDGIKRNPWNEIECGSNYARPMASFALLPIYSGFTFDLPHQTIGFAPIASGDFRCLWSLGSGWGDYLRTGITHQLILRDGSLTLSALRLGGIGAVTSVTADGVPVNFTQEGDILHFDAVTITRELTIKAK